VTSCSEKIQQI